MTSCASGLRWLPTVLGLCDCVAEILSTREISSATRNTRGGRCTSGGFLKIASWYTRAGLRGIVGWSREEIEILIFVTSHR
jgi:hypothetical protein